MRPDTHAEEDGAVGQVHPEQVVSDHECLEEEAEEAHREADGPTERTEPLLDVPPPLCTSCLSTQETRVDCPLPYDVWGGRPRLLVPESRGIVGRCPVVRGNRGLSVTPRTHGFFYYGSSWGRVPVPLDRVPSSD